MKKTAATIFLAAAALLIGACAASVNQETEEDGVGPSLDTQTEALPSSPRSSPIPQICFNGCNRIACKKPSVKAACIAACPANLVKECKKA